MLAKGYLTPDDAREARCFGLLTLVPRCRVLPSGLTGKFAFAKDATLMLSAIRSCRLIRSSSPSSAIIPGASIQLNAC